MSYVLMPEDLTPDQEPWVLTSKDVVAEPALKPKRTDRKVDKPTLKKIKSQSVIEAPPSPSPLEGYDMQAEGGQSQIQLQTKPATSLDFRSPEVSIKTVTPKLKLTPTKARRREDESFDEFNIRASQFESGKKQQEQQAKAERAAVASKVRPDKGLAKYPTAFAQGTSNVLAPLIRRGGLAAGIGPEETWDQQGPALNVKESGEWGTKIAEGLGSTVPFALTAAMTGTAGTALLGASSNAAQTYEEALAHGSSHEDALASAIPGALIGSLEGLMGLGTGKFVGQMGKGSVKSLLAGIGEEEFQELTSQTLNNVNAKILSGYDPKRAISEGLYDTFVTTLGTAGLAHGATMIGSQPAATPKALPSFLPTELAQMEKRSLDAGKPIALQPETRDAFAARNQEIKQQLMTLDPSSGEFAKLADEHTRLARAIDDAPDIVPDSTEALRQHLIEKNLGHEGAADEMLAVLRPAPDVATAERVNEIGPRFYPNKSSETKGGNVYLSPEALDTYFVDSRGERSGIGALNESVDKVEAKAAEIADEQPALAATLMGAVNEARSKGLNQVSLITYRQGQGLPETRKLIRHESFHTGQWNAAEQGDIRSLHSPDILYHPSLTKMASSETGQQVLNYYEGDHDSLAVELAAYAAGGQHDLFGLTTTEAADYLTEYLTGIADQQGPEALDALAGVARLRPSVAQKVEEVKLNAEQQRSKLGSANRNFADSLRGLASVSSSEERSPGSSPSGERVDEGRPAETADPAEAGGVAGGPPTNPNAGPGVQSRKLKVVRIEGLTPGVTQNPNKGKFYYPANSKNADYVKRSGRPLTEIEIDLGNSLKVKNKVEALKQLGAPLDYIAGHLGALDEDIEEAGGLEAYVDQAINYGAFGPSETWDAEIAKRAKAAGYSTIQYEKEPDGGGGYGPEVVDFGNIPPPNSSEEGGGGSGGNLYTTVLTSDVVKEYAKKSGEALRQLGWLDPTSTLPPHEQLLKVLRERPDLAEPAAIGQALREQGVTGDETLQQIDETITNAAKTLQAVQAAGAEWNQIIKEFPKVAAELGKAGVGPSPGQMARTVEKEVQAAFKEVQASVLGRDLWRRSGDLYRKTLLTRFSTAANNAVSTLPRIPLDLMDGIMTGIAMGALQPAKWAGKPNATIAEGATAGAVASAQASMRVAMAFPGAAKRLLRRADPAHEFNENIIAQMEQLHPDLHSKLNGRSTGLDDLTESKVNLDKVRDLLPYLNDADKFKEYSAKLDLYQKRYDFNHRWAGKLFDKTNWVYDQFLKPGNLQEFFFRRPYFVGALAKRAADAGFDLTELARNAGTLRDFAADPAGKDAVAITQLHTLADLPPEVWSAAADDALTFTYAYAPKTDRGRIEKFAANYIEFMDSMGPIGAVVDAFPKALYNGLKFAYEYSPLGAMRPMATMGLDAAQEGKAGIKYDDVSRVSKAVLGTAMYAVALMIRREAGGEEWYQIKTGKKDKKGQPIYKDVRKLMPFAGFLYVADVIDRWSSGRLGDKKPMDEAAELYFGARRTDNKGAVFADAIKETSEYWAFDMPMSDRLVQAGKKPLGQILGAPLTPFVNVRDLIAQFDEDEAAKRDMKGAPILGPSIDKIPFLRSSEKFGLPLYQPPTEPAPQANSYAPALTEVGVSLDPGSNFATREFSRLGLSPIKWLKPDPDPKINRAQYAAYAEILGELAPELERDISYRQMPDAEKAAMWEKLLSGSGFAAMAKAAGEAANPEEMSRRALRKTQSPLQRKASGLDKTIQDMKNSGVP